MIVIPYDSSLISEQQHATFEREGWGIFNDNEIEHINNMLEWLDVDKIPKGFKQLSSDKQASKRARKHGFIVIKNKHDVYIITHIVINNWKF